MSFLKGLIHWHKGGTQRSFWVLVTVAICWGSGGFTFSEEKALGETSQGSTYPFFSKEALIANDCWDWDKNQLNNHQCLVMTGGGCPQEYDTMSEKSLTGSPFSASHSIYSTKRIALCKKHPPTYSQLFKSPEFSEALRSVGCGVKNLLQSYSISSECRFLDGKSLLVCDDSEELKVSRVSGSDFKFCKKKSIESQRVPNGGVPPRGTPASPHPQGATVQ